MWPEVPYMCSIQKISYPDYGTTPYRRHNYMGLPRLSEGRNERNLPSLPSLRSYLEGPVGFRVWGLGYSPS